MNFSGTVAGFSTFADIECSMLIESSFRILNGFPGIPLSPLSLLTAVLPKACLTLHTRIPGSGWVITPLWLFGSLRSFFCTVLCILSNSSWSLLFLLGLYSFCPLLCPCLGEIFPWYFQFSWNSPIKGELEGTAYKNFV